MKLRLWLLVLLGGCGTRVIELGAAARSAQDAAARGVTERSPVVTSPQNLPSARWPDVDAALSIAERECREKKRDPALCGCLAALAAGRPVECPPEGSRRCVVEPSEQGQCLRCVDPTNDAPVRLCLRCGDVTSALPALACRQCEWEDLPRQPCTRCLDPEGRVARDDCLIQRREMLLLGP